ncbi:hypothetical protein PSU4_23230 [Pseudonocardia sulfidoxydans NBRC 16205]|uniref:Excalibur calcium-binding domain-containing protein n=2 Tax=Pseudonocardia sulfidoxydans TaxID=54011 RepID=A0A511DEZ9_9PSEU|nr:excalibur calcium-binding domain-containing protein [Pseudonocardia sulfidoxydans]GEL23369.1 hypothetical protein PSU4_23230 [Pseudonocardia sulfidoxydans NBRC 16205]
MTPRTARRAGSLAAVALAAALLLQACGSSEPSTPRSFASAPTSTTVTSTSPTPTTTTTTSATPTTVVPVVPVVPAQVPVPTTRVAAKTVAPQGLVAPPTTKKQSANSGSTGGGAAYYKNCSAVRAAGKAPILRGQPGYAAHLDRDNDGIGCE